MHATFFAISRCTLPRDRWEPRVDWQLLLSLILSTVSFATKTCNICSALKTLCSFPRNPVPDSVYELRTRLGYEGRSDLTEEVLREEVLAIRRFRRRRQCRTITCML